MHVILPLIKENSSKCGALYHTVGPLRRNPCLLSGNFLVTEANGKFTSFNFNSIIVQCNNVKFCVFSLYSIIDVKFYGELCEVLAPYLV